MKRFWSTFLIVFLLAGSVWPVTDGPQPEGKGKSYISVLDRETVVSNFATRSAKPTASPALEGYTVNHPLRFEEAHSWSPIPGSLLLSRFIRQPFFTTIAINAP